MAVRIENNGEPIPGYKLLERIGGGGFGDVWKVEAPGGLLKAIKFVFGDLADAGEDAQRAEQELKALKRVQTVRHPYILSLERYDIIDGQLLIVMELADRNLWDRFKECRSEGLPGIPREELLRYMEETAEALDLMNLQYGLQHLDIKPQNVFLVHNHVKVADFGLVKDLEGMAASVTGGVTPVYAAPETFDGWVSRYSDQYSFAIVYQELLTGQRPFSGSNVRQLILQHLQATPNVAMLPASDQPTILRALSKNPDERFPSCTDLVRALRGNDSPGTNGRHPIRETPPEENEGPRPSRSEQGSGAADGNGMPTDDLRGRVVPLSQPSSHLPPTQPNGMATPVRPSGDRREVPVTVSRFTEKHRTLPAARADVSTSNPTPAPPTASLMAETCGDGILFPALIVGLGQQGALVLQRLRAVLLERFGNLEALPHLRWLLLDTDQEVPRLMTRGQPGVALSAGEILLAKLNRPSHYLRPRDGRRPVDSWLDPKMLYRMPRGMATGGLRALGRLAFCDNYLSIIGRLRHELAALCETEGLTVANRQTRLGLRNHRPRVYVVTGLAGGTGSGMFIDMAYSLRSLLQGIGQIKPETVGMFFLPKPDRSAARILAAGNTYAALTELRYYSEGNRYTAHFHDKEEPLADKGPPYGRCLMLQMPEEKDVKGIQAALGLGAEYLYRDLFTPLGRATEECRAKAGPRGTSVPRGADATFTSFGMFRLSSPQRPLIEQSARRWCQRLVKRWMSKDSTALVPLIQTWVSEHWKREEAGPELLIAHLREACLKALGQEPEQALAAIVEPILKRGQPALDLDAVDQVMKQLQKVIGRPEEETMATRPGVLEEALAEASKEVVDGWRMYLAEQIVLLIEDPAYRLAGAEEAIRQITAILEQWLQHQETLGKEMEKRMIDEFLRIYNTLAALDKNTVKSNRVLAAIAELEGYLKSYPKWRYQFIVLRQTTRGLISLRGNLNDELREINFCRLRLVDLLKSLELPVTQSPSGRKECTPERCPEKKLFSSGCQDLEEAVEQVQQALTPEQDDALEERIQIMIRRQFRGLVAVCMGATNVVKILEAMMQQEAEAFVAAGPVGSHVADLFLEQYPNEDQAAEEIVTCHEEASPEWTGKRSGPAAEFSILAVPPGPAGQSVQELAKKALPDVRFATTTSADDILLYRECPQLKLADLDHLGPAGYEAYRQMTTTDHLTPHTRIDVPFGDQ
jgi:serine/threonine protein kinase